MKILRLRFTNLNSLRDEWRVDFTISPLSDAGLFAITGPTGAGKTTLLDAMTLALYGRAARYGADPNPEQVMSRHTGSCSAEVEFSCATGVYRSVWQLQRARNKPGGRVQNPKRKVVSLPDEQVLTEKIDDSNRKIEELTGLNYDRFLRSVMLAQGDFAAFLKAKPNERTELLEQVTGTRIYSDISIAAYRRSESARLAHEALVFRLTSVQVLPAEARTEREQQVATTRSRLNEIKLELGKLETRISDAKAFLACADEAAKIESEANQLALERKSATAELGALELHEKAAPFIARLTARDLLAKQQEEDETKLASLRLQLPKLLENFEKARADAEAARISLERAEREEETLKPLWAEVTKLDGEISVARHGVARRTETRQQAEAAQQKLQEDLASKQRDLEKQHASLSELSSWILNNEGDARIANVIPELQSTFARWKDNSSQWKEIHEEVASLERTIQVNEATLAATAAAAVKLKTEWEAKDAKAGKVRDELAKLTDERAILAWEKDRDAAQLRVGKLTEILTFAGEFATNAARRQELQNESKDLAEKEEALAVERATQQGQLQTATDLTVARRKNLDLVQLVQSLEQHRHALVEGQECPLCGSTEHPYASPANVPSSELNSATAELTKAEKNLEKVRSDVANLEKQQTAISTEKKRAVLDLKATSDKIAQSEKQWTAQATLLEIRFTPTQTEELAALLSVENKRSAMLRQRVDDLRALDLKLRETERASEDAKAVLKEKAAEKDKLDGLLAQTRGSLAKAFGRVKASEVSVNESKASFIQGVAAFGLTAPELSAAEEGLARLKQRSEGFTAKTSTRTSFEGQIKVSEASIGEVQKQLKEASIGIAKLKQEETSEQQKLQALLTARQGRFDDKEVTTEQKRVSDGIKTCRKASESATGVLNDARHKHDSCKTQIEDATKAASQRGTRISTDTTSLACAAKEAGFSSIELLRQAVLPEKHAQELVALLKRLNNGEQALVGRRKSNQAAQSKLPGAAKDDALYVENLLVQRTTHENERQNLDQKSGALQEELRQDDERRKSQLEIAGQIEGAEREFHRWARLSGLIGSATGNVFSRFAQGLTLERLVAVANCHLVQLNPRYSMRRSAEAIDDLEL